MPWQAKGLSQSRIKVLGDLPRLRAVEAAISPGWCNAAEASHAANTSTVLIDRSSRLSGVRWIGTAV